MIVIECYRFAEDPETGDTFGKCAGVRRFDTFLHFVDEIRGDKAYCEHFGLADFERHDQWAAAIKIGAKLKSFGPGRRDCIFAAEDGSYREYTAEYAG